MQSEHINLHITDETAELKTVILGIGTSPGKPRLINTKSIETFKAGKQPTEANFISDINAFEQVLRDNSVTVLKPTNIDNLKQIFVRDIGFVIDDYFVVARMQNDKRRKEIEGLKFLSTMFDKERIIHPLSRYSESVSLMIEESKFVDPQPLFIEGGDVVLFGDIIFVGIGERTNQAGVDFLREAFPNKEIISFKMRYGTGNSHKDILHLDCAFQPIGKQWALFHEQGFVSSPQPIVDIFGRENLIPISCDEMEQLFPNIFSLSPTKVVSCATFSRLNDLLEERGINVIKIPYEHVSSIGGLLRCSTLPLMREKN